MCGAATEMDRIQSVHCFGSDSKEFEFFFPNDVSSETSMKYCNMTTRLLILEFLLLPECIVREYSSQRIRDFRSKCSGIFVRSFMV